MPWRCPVCGTINEDDAEFCVNCGAPRPGEETGEAPGEAPSLAEPRRTGEAEEAAAVEQQAPLQEGAEEAEETGEEQAAGEAEEAAGYENLYLEVVNTPAHELIGKKIPLMFNVFPKITIGRSPESVIVVPDPTVSRRHAVIEQVDGRVVLRDLGSTNGTYVYDPETGGFNRVEEVELKPGLMIRLGESTILRVVAE